MARAQRTEAGLMGAPCGAPRDHRTENKGIAMDTEKIDALARRLAGALSRRGLLRVGATAAAVVLPALRSRPLSDVGRGQEEEEKEEKEEAANVPTSFASYRRTPTVWRDLLGRDSPVLCRDRILRLPRGVGALLLGGRGRGCLPERPGQLLPEVLPAHRAGAGPLCPAHGHLLSS